jgi:hypothetical protein
MISNFSNLPLANTNKPRETYVHDGSDTVIKRPTDLLPQSAWLDKQLHAKKVSDQLIEIGNPGYFVPRTLDIATAEYFSVEQRISGQPLSAAYFETLSEEHRAIIYNAAANFCNDINQMMPVLTRDNFEPGISLETVRGILSSKEFNKIKRAQIWLKENASLGSSMVFSQGDMNSDNIFYDKDKKLVSFIDFADARYQSAYEMFYHDFTRLGWVNAELLIENYKALPKRQHVVIEKNENVDKISSHLKSIMNDIKTIASQKGNPNNALIKTMKETIKKLPDDMKKIKAESLHGAAVAVKGKFPQNLAAIQKTL